MKARTCAIWTLVEPGETITSHSIRFYIWHTSSTRISHIIGLLDLSFNASLGGICPTMPIYGKIRSSPDDQLLYLTYYLPSKRTSHMTGVRISPCFPFQNAVHIPTTRAPLVVGLSAATFAKGLI